MCITLPLVLCKNGVGVSSSSMVSIVEVFVYGLNWVHVLRQQRHVRKRDEVMGLLHNSMR